MARKGWSISRKKVSQPTPQKTTKTQSTSNGYANIRQQALSSITTGSNNIAIGHSAGRNLTTGSNNIAIGYGYSSVNYQYLNDRNITSKPAMVHFKISNKWDLPIKSLCGLKLTTHGEVIDWFTEGDTRNCFGPSHLLTCQDCIDHPQRVLYEIQQTDL